MIAAIVVRRFRLGHKKKVRPVGSRISLPENQFEDLKSAGLVERAPVRAKKPRSKCIADPGN